MLYAIAREGETIPRIRQSRTMSPGMVSRLYRSGYAYVEPIRGEIVPGDDGATPSHCDIHYTTPLAVAPVGDCGAHRFTCPECGAFIVSAL